MRAKNDKDNRLCYEFLKTEKTTSRNLRETEKYLFGSISETDWMDTYHPEFDYCEAVIHRKYKYLNEAYEPDINAELYDDFSVVEESKASYRAFVHRYCKFMYDKFGDEDSMTEYILERRPDLDK